MRRLVPLTLLLLALALTAGASAARDPRLEQERLTAADIALAKRIVLRRSDLGAGWSRMPLPRSEERLTCPGFNPDFSAFTITGKAQSAFIRSSGASVASAVEVYETRRDAVGDFRLGAKPVVARCLRIALEREMEQQSGAGFRFTVRSAQVVRAPRVGERSIAYRVVGRVEARGVAVDIYMDVVAMQRGRSVAALFFTSPEGPFAGQRGVVAAVGARMR